MGEVTTNPIFTPMLTVMGLTFVVWVYLFARRIPYILSMDKPDNELTAKDLGELAPNVVSNPSDNFRNLFEVPVIFYALTLYLAFTQQVDDFYIIAAWVFAIGRVAHSLIHCSINIVMLRFVVYLVSCLALWVMLARAILGLLG